MMKMLSMIWTMSRTWIMIYLQKLFMMSSNGAGGGEMNTQLKEM